MRPCASAVSEDGDGARGRDVNGRQRVRNTLGEIYDGEGKPVFSDVRQFVARRLLPVLAKGAVAGVVVGAVVTLFNYLLEVAGEFAALFAAAGRSRGWLSACYVAFMICVAFFMYFFTAVFPEGRGSGIPRTEAAACGKMKFKWWRLCLATVIGSTVSFFAGIPVGAEGPSVQLGGGLGAGVEEADGTQPLGRRPVMSAGIAAGVTSAFIAPATGFLFVLEEVQRKFDPLACACAAVSVFYAYAVRVLLGGAIGMKEVFIAAESVAALPMAYMWAPLVAGIFAALVARLFNAVILRADCMSARSRLSRLVPLVVVFALSGVVNIFLADQVGSGMTLINAVIGGDYGWTDMLVALVVKFALMCMVFRAAPTGGMMVPMLAIGAMTGHLAGTLCAAMGMPAEYVAVVALVTMCAFFGASIKAPFTVVLLFLETTALWNNAAAVMVAVLVATVAVGLLGQKPLYDTLWVRDLERRKLNSVTYRAVAK